MSLTEQQVADLVARHVSDGIVIQDMEGRILWANASYGRITGYELSEIQGRRPQEFLLPPDHKPSDQEIAAFRYNPGSDLFNDYEVIENVRKSGERYWVQLSFAEVDTVDGPRIVLTARDVSAQITAQDALRRAKAQLENVVNYDVLTGLANRRRLTEFLEKALVEAAQKGSRLAVFHVDLDRFKEINDTHGHSAGDAVLIHVARLMEQTIVEGDLVARVGGDEFIVVMPHGSDCAQYTAFADRLLARFEEPFQWQNVTLGLGASIGIAISTRGQHDVEELIGQADFALYEVKAKGRGAFACYDGALRDKHYLRRSLADDLRQTIDNDGLLFLYQPVLSIDQRRIVGVEALARWDHPTHGCMAPSEFLPVAEDMGFLRNIDLSAMRASVHALAQIEAMGLTDIKVSFNASSHTLVHGGLVDQMKWAVDQLEVPHHLLGVEVLETVFFDGAAAGSSIATEIDRLGNAGFPTVLDDFGTGFAGLSHLARLNVTGIKIDKSLVSTILSDVNSAAIVRAIIRLARELDLLVIAEGVESPDIVDMLEIYGCNQIQGYGISHPLPLQDLLTWLARYDPKPVFWQRDDHHVLKSG